ALGFVVGAAVLADQVTKHIVASQLALDDSVHVLGPFSIHHVQNSGIAFGLFANATALVTALTALAVGWMLVFFARSGARHRVPPDAAGDRLDRFVATLPEVASRAEAERLLAGGAVRVDGEPRPKSHRLAGGELLEVDAAERRDVALEPETRDLRIAYEDEQLLVVDKPSGLVVHPSAGHSGGTLVQALLERGIAGGHVPDRPG